MKGLSMTGLFFCVPPAQANKAGVKIGFDFHFFVFRKVYPENWRIEPRMNTNEYEERLYSAGAKGYGGTGLAKMNYLRLRTKPIRKLLFEHIRKFCLVVNLHFFFNSLCTNTSHLPGEV